MVQGWGGVVMCPSTQPARTLQGEGGRCWTNCLLWQAGVPDSSQLQHVNLHSRFFFECGRQQRELQAMGGAMGLHWDPAAAAAVRTSGSSTPSAPAAAAMEAGPSQQQPSGQGGSSHSSSTAVATYRLPSFNWLTACLSECRRLIDRCAIGDDARVPRMRYTAPLSLHMHPAASLNTSQQSLPHSLCSRLLLHPPPPPLPLTPVGPVLPCPPPPTKNTTGSSQLSCPPCCGPVPASTTPLT